MKMLGIVVMVMALAVPVGIAQAQYYYGEGPYIGFSVGSATYDIDIGNWDDGSIVSGSVDDNDAGVKFFWGYMLSNNFGFELFYANLGETSFEGVSSGDGDIWAAGNVSGFTKNSGYGFSAIANIPFGSHVEAFGKAGMFRWTTRHRENDSSGAFRYSDSGTDMMFGGGLALNVTDRSAVRVEWERFTDVYDIYDIDLISLGFVHKF
jgi:OmpA-OmpF porin, OOP family